MAGTNFDGARPCRPRHSRAPKLLKPQVEIYDTTLRDGAQDEGVNFSAVDKLYPLVLIWRVRHTVGLDAMGLPEQL